MGVCVCDVARAHLAHTAHLTLNDVYGKHDSSLSLSLSLYVRRQYCQLSNEIHHISVSIYFTIAMLCVSNAIGHCSCLFVWPAPYVASGGASHIHRTIIVRLR